MKPKFEIGNKIRVRHGNGTCFLATIYAIDANKNRVIYWINENECVNETQVVSVITK